jgi:tetratricopeptide (TPR) repeat protein
MKLVNFLQNLASQVRGGFALGIHINRIVDIAEYLPSLSQEDSPAYGQFLREVLQATITSGGDPRKLYPLLKENRDKLDDKLAQLLQRWATTILEDAKLDEAKYLAAVIVEFSRLTQQFPLGNKASNMEIVIIGYEVALTVYTRDAFPYEWAMTQNNLADAYNDRIRGERAENLEQAITCLHEALKVYTFEAFPYEWARAQNNLAVAYSGRIRGEQAENLE